MKVCPVCKSRCFDDMKICYGCMHKFEDDCPTEMISVATDVDQQKLTDPSTEFIPQYFEVESYPIIEDIETFSRRQTDELANL